MTGLAVVAPFLLSWAGATAAVHLPVPVIRQDPERCGPAALAMVLRYYGADSAAVAEADKAYDPVLRGALVTELAACARRVGFPSTIATLPSDSLVPLLRQGVPPILLYPRGVGPLTRGHYGVLVGWDPERRQFLVNEGGASTRRFAERRLLARWRGAGSRALIVRIARP